MNNMNLRDLRDEFSNQKLTNQASLFENKINLEEHLFKPLGLLKILKRLKIFDKLYMKIMMKYLQFFKKQAYSLKQKKEI